MYVTGNKNDGGNNHVSLYVRIEDTESLPTGWEVDVDLKLFVHNPKTHKYLTVTGIFSSFISQNLYNVLWTLLDPFHFSHSASYIFIIHLPRLINELWIILDPYNAGLTF